MFINARIKLTAWYLLIIMFISLAFSTVIYRVLTVEFQRFERLHRFRIENKFSQEFVPPPEFRNRIVIPLDPELIKEAKDRLLLVLLLINSGILVISGGLAYFLAGRTLRPIREMLDEQNRFISDASHELRTPLTSLKTAMEVALRDRKLTLLQARKIITENISEVNKIQSLSDQLLKLAQYEKPNGNIRREKINLKDIIEKAVNIMSPIANEKKISVNADLMNMEVNGERESLTDLFVILLDNAVKYSPKESRIDIDCQLTEKNIIAHVSDQGIGISKKDLPHIFDRFYRADVSRTKTQAKGYGLGLSIAKKIADMHKGAIKVKRKVNEGTVFLVQFPRLKS